MGTGLIPADGEIWKVRRRAIVPALHRCALCLNLCVPVLAIHVCIGTRNLEQAQRLAAVLLKMSACARRPDGSRTDDFPGLLSLEAASSRSEMHTSCHAWRVWQRPSGTLPVVQLEGALAAVNGACCVRMPSGQVYRLIPVSFPADM